MVPYYVHGRAPGARVAQSRSPVETERGQSIGAAVHAPSDTLPVEAPPCGGERPKDLVERGAVCDRAEPRSAGTVTYHWEVVTNDPASAGARRKGRVEKATEGSLARIGLRRLGIVGGGESSSKRGEEGNPTTARGVVPQEGTAPGDLGTGTHPPSAPVEGELEGPETAVRWGDERPGDRQFGSRRERASGVERSPVASAARAPGRAPIGSRRGVGHLAGWGKPATSRQEPASIEGGGCEDKRR